VGDLCFPSPEQRSGRKVTLLIGAAFLLASCNNNPYAVSVNEFNEREPQRPAAVQISDPHLYARETLLNDRRREVQYLRRLIDQSETVIFEPQLKRAISSVRALSGSLSATVDPLGGGQASRTAELERRQHEINLNDKQIQLIEQERRLIEARKRLDAAKDSPASDKPPNDPTTTVTVDQNKVDQLNREITKLQNDIAELKKQAGVPSDLKNRLPDTSQFRSTDVSSTPQELFRDRQAYRDELRSAQAAAELDDSHDYYGNGLYRLKFDATIAPGRDKDKFAVARLTVDPPEFTDAEVEGVYKLWLSHVAFRLNGIADGSLRADFGYQVLGVDANFYHYVDYKLPSGHPLRIVVPPKLLAAATDLFVPKQESRSITPIASSAAIEQLIANLEDILDDYQVASAETEIRVRRFGEVQQRLSAEIELQEKEAEAQTRHAGEAREKDDQAQVQSLEAMLAQTTQRLEALRANRTRAASEHDAASAQRRELSARFALAPNCELADLSLAKVAIDGSNKLANVGNLVQKGAGPGGAFSDVLAFAAASLRGMGDRPAFQDERDRQEIDKLVRLIARFQAGLLRFNDLFGRKPSDPACQAKAKAGLVPTYFTNFVRNTANEPGRGAFAYAATPVELAQRVSTIASAISSLELALAVTAHLQQFAGLNLDANLKYMQAAQGKVDALERLPLVVGFSDRQVAGDKSTGQKAQFGWVFGPRAVVDPKEKEVQLRQALQNYTVTADLSVPAWWPYVRFRLEAGWIANWHGMDGTNPILRSGERLAETRVFTRPLPHNRADLDGLTEALAYKTMGGTLATTRIVRVEPADVSLCDTVVTLLVYGANVWRGTQAYLNGVQAASIDVLPDMAGLAATFNVRNLPRSKGDGAAKLVVWTRNGPAERDVTVRQTADCAGRSESSYRGVMALPRLLGDGREVRIAVTPVLAAFHGVALQVRPRTQADGTTLAWSSLPASGAQFAEDGKTLVLTLEGVPSAVLKFKEGTPVEAQLAVTPRPGGAVVSIPATPPLIYYSAEAKAKATVAAAAGGSTLAELGDKLVIQLPPAVRSAFAGFDPSAIAASVDGAPEFELKAIAEPPTKDDKIAMRLSLQKGDMDALRKKARKISLKFSGNDVPELCSGCLDLSAKVSN
jgi:hypothetical protein